MTYTNPSKALSLLSRVRSLLSEGEDATSLDSLISSAQSCVDECTSQEIQSYFKDRKQKSLRNCDWTQLSDEDISEEEKAAWDQYRSDIRALSTPTNKEELEALTWPTEPS